jgi:hypothetical protein
MLDALIVSNLSSAPSFYPDVSFIFVDRFFRIDWPSILQGHDFWETVALCAFTLLGFLVSNTGCWKHLLFALPDPDPWKNVGILGLNKSLFLEFPLADNSKSGNRACDFSRAFVCVPFSWRGTNCVGGSFGRWRGGGGADSYERT